MPALVPGVQPFAAFTGTYTLSADQESMTIGASPAEVVATPWYDMGSSATLARVQWDGTATGTIQGRTSAIRFATGNVDHPTDPGTWDTTGYYDPTLGTLPTSQGYTLVAGSLAGTGSGATYRARLTTTTSGQTFRVYSAGLGLDSGALIQCQIRIGHVSGTGRAGVSLRAPVGTSAFGGGTFVGFEIDPATGILFAVNGSGTPNGDVAIPDWATVKEHDFMVRLVGGSASVRPATWELWRRPVASASLSSDDPAPYTLLGTWLTIAANDYPAITCGSWWNGGTAVWDYGQIRWYGGTAEWETVTDGDTSFARNQRYWQVKGWENGTLTEVDLQSDLSAPGNPSGPEAAAVGASAIGGNCTSLASGAAAYYVECLDADAADAVVQADWVLSPVHAFRGLTVPGNFKVRFTSASDDGVRGSASVTTDSTPVPVSTAAATAPTIGPYPRWVSSELRFYRPQPGTNTLTGGTYAILSATQAAGAYTVADSNSWASITWRATDGVGQYVTAADLGLTVSDTAWYRDRITDSGNLVAEGQTAAYGGDTANAYCAITFTGLTAGTTVACRLSDAVELDGVTYPAGPYSATVDGSGNATLSVPRCNAATGTTSDGVPFGYFTGGSPTAFVLERLIPDAATATFASLSHP
jgi:hypothetical protein